MSLDAFMGSGKKKKTTKQKMKKSSKKTALKIKKNEQNQTIQNVKKIEESSSSFTLLKITLACSSKCGYKKILKRPKSFNPKEKDLICPRCNKQMKIIK